MFYMVSRQCISQLLLYLHGICSDPHPIHSDSTYCLGHVLLRLIDVHVSDSTALLTSLYTVVLQATLVAAMHFLVLCGYTLG